MTVFLYRGLKKKFEVIDMPTYLHFSTKDNLKYNLFSKQNLTKFEHMGKIYSHLFILWMMKH